MAFIEKRYCNIPELNIKLKCRVIKYSYENKCAKEILSKHLIE